jgi:hypothetical protein
VEYAVKCHCGKVVSLWEIGFHLEDCKHDEFDEDFIDDFVDEWVLNETEGTNT